MDAAPDRPAEYVEGLARGIAILESFDAAHPEMTLSDVARRCALSPAAARRGLLTLCALGYVGQRDKRFHLRPRVMTLGSAFYFSARIGELLQPELRHLVENFGDAASIGTLDGSDVIYIASVSVQRARRAAAVIGARYPAHATSIGRVLLAGLPPPDLAARLAGPLDKLTSRTLADPCALAREIARVREDGYATTVDQLDYGITALAVPVRGRGGRWIAALNTSGYTGMVTPDSLVAERLPELRATARRIGETIAATPVIETIIGT
jgi:IclR family transcriptional regulator, pca regulon regulatory protein